MTRWRKIEAGDHVELRGKVFEVVKIKPKGSAAKVTVRSAAGTFESKVPLDGKVTRVADPLHDETGAMRRWAKPAEAPKREAIPAGDPSITKAPRKLSGDPWDTPRDKVERRLEAVLGAVLIAEATDESEGYYVPPVDVTTIMGHWVVFHGGDPTDYEGEAETIKAHEFEHADRLKDPGAYAPLKVNHWHTKTRPETHA